MSSVPVKTPEFSPFWEKKCLSIIRKMNVAGHGRITKGDYEALGDRYIEIGNLDGPRAKQVKRKVVKLWDDYLSQASVNDEMNEETFIQCLKDHKDKLLESGLQMGGLFFDLIDLNGDGVIQQEEYALFLKVFRVEDEQEIKEAFKVIDTDGSGQLSHDEFIYAVCQYLMSSDESLPANSMFGSII